MRIALVAVGVVMILVGAANIISRFAQNSLGGDAAFVAFAPAAALQNPQLFSQSSSTTTRIIIPARLKVPSIGVDAKVQHVGQKSDGSMAAPSAMADAAWYKLGPKPGEHGNAVFAGHVNNALTTAAFVAGVFEHLADVKLGDYITVEDAAGKALVYRVSEIDEYKTTDAPTNKIFATGGPSQLVLITCDGEWVAADHSYDKRLVVIARLAQ